MAYGRDDFIIAIRSAFLKKGTRQKFSLFTLLVASCLVLSLEYFKTGPIEKFRYITRDIIYRSAYIISSPFKLIHNTYENFNIHMNMYDEYLKLKDKEFNLNSTKKEIEFYKAENLRLKELINETNLIEDSFIVSRVLIDKQSPFLKSIIINKGFESGIKKGMPVLDKSYIVGRVVETNYMSSRVLLVNDLNSKISVIIEPGSTNAIMSGSGKEYAELEYLAKKDLINEGNIVYTSGADGIFDPGIPIGKVLNQNGNKIVTFYADLDQLNFVKIKNITEKK